MATVELKLVATLEALHAIANAISRDYPKLRFTPVHHYAGGGNIRAIRFQCDWAETTALCRRIVQHCELQGVKVAA